jgi:hypothetical protein
MSSHTNFMGAECYELFNPIQALRLPLCSQFLGEPSYYMPATDTEPKDELKLKKTLDQLGDNVICPKYCLMSRQKAFYEAANLALDYNFAATLEEANKARNKFFMRKTPAQLLAIAASQPGRIEFSKKNPKAFRDVVKQCCPLPGDIESILDAWKSLHGSKSKFPSFMKRAFQDRLSDLTAYHAGKYSRAIIDMTRISHVKKKIVVETKVLDPLMKNGKLQLDDSAITWEKHRSQGKTWVETFDAMDGHIPHMAALRNLRGFSQSNPGIEYMKKYCSMLLSGVKNGKQFPYRYISAYEECKKASKGPETETSAPAIHKHVQKKKGGYIPKVKPPIKPVYFEMMETCLQKCLQKSIENFPSLQGNVMVLTDNSGSAHGACTSKYGTRTVADIGNLSALLTALSCTGKGVVGIFGDKLHEYTVDKSRSLLEQYEEITELGKTVGGGTENGIWVFFKRAFANPADYSYDHLFCYSDMQAGHGQLYGSDPEMQEQYLCKHDARQRYIDVMSLINDYRKTLNPKVNIFMVQTAGYNDAIIPQTTYRGAILAGWTGNEVVYADQLVKLWDEVENVG